MKKEHAANISRRAFVCSLPPIVVGGLSTPCVYARNGKQEKPGFWAEFTAEERQQVDSSVMAQDITNFAGHGYGCAECSLVVGLRYLGEPEERLSAAAVFSGGLGKGDLCGYFSGSMMAIGIAARKLYKDREEMHAFARQQASAFWEWWESRGPVHCRDLRKRYEGTEEFVRMGQRVVVKLEELIADAR